MGGIVVDPDQNESMSGRASCVMFFQIPRPIVIA